MALAAAGRGGVSDKEIAGARAIAALAAEHGATSA
jgi:hypothetical protein